MARSTFGGARRRPERPNAVRALAVLAALATACASAGESGKPPRDSSDAAARSPAAPAPERPAAAPPVVEHRPGQMKAGAAERARALRSAVHELASASFADTAGIAARALLAMSDSLALVSGASSSQAVAKLREEASALADLRSVSLERSDRVKAGLEHALAALRATEPADGWLEQWISAASEAVEAVDPMLPFGLQPARIQDAFRAVSDGVLVALQLGEAS